MDTTTAASGVANERTFEECTRSVLTKLRNALSQATSALPDGAQKSHDLEHQLGVSFPFSLQIYRLLRTENLLEVPQHVPTRRPMEKFLTALGTNGVPTERVDAIRGAFDDYESHVKTWAGDQPSFEAMVARLTEGAPISDVESTHRRALFEAHRYVLGVEQDVYAALTIVHPHQRNPRLVDLLSVRVRHRLRRLRMDVPLRVDVSRSYRVQAGAESSTKAVRKPLDDQSYEKYGIYILPKYCSTEDLPLVQKESENGLVVTTWKGQDVGMPSAINLAIGSVLMGCELGTHGRGLPGHKLVTTMITPTRYFIQDILVHRATLFPMESEVTRWGYITDGVGPTGRIEDSDVPKLPCAERMTLVGSADGCYLPEIPEYLTMVHECCAKMNWNPNDLVLYRMRMEHPMLHTLLQIESLFPQAKQ